MPGHRDQLRLCPPPPESGDKATAFLALESMNGGGGGGFPPGHHTWCLQAHPPRRVWVTSEETLPVKHTNQGCPSCLCTV